MKKIGIALLIVAVALIGVSFAVGFTAKEESKVEPQKIRGDREEQQIEEETEQEQPDEPQEEPVEQISLDGTSWYGEDDGVSYTLVFANGRMSFSTLTSDGNSSITGRSKYSVNGDELIEEKDNGEVVHSFAMDDKGITVDGIKYTQLQEEESDMPQGE